MIDLDRSGCRAHGLPSNVGVGVRERREQILCWARAKTLLLGQKRDCVLQEVQTQIAQTIALGAVLRIEGLVCQRAGGKDIGAASSRPPLDLSLITDDSR